MSYRSFIPTVSFAEPLSVSDIDNHPDRDRIWATLRKVELEMRSEIEALEEDLREEEAGRGPGQNDWEGRRTVAERAAEAASHGFREGYGLGHDKGFLEGKYEGSVHESVRT